MKQILIILGLFASITTFAQSPRIKLNQITKDTVKGSVLISSPTDSGMVYSRDFYVAYGADTVLILYGDTLAATSGIISSVLSDGVTITGNGTSGNELKVDTSLIATIKALNDSLATISASTTPDGVTITGDGSVGNPLKVDTATVISTIQGLVDTLTARGYLTANETITLSGDVTGSGTTAITATVVDDSHNHIISNVDFLQDSLTAKANASELSNYLLTSNYIVDSTRINATGDTAFYYQNGVEIGSQSIAGGGGTTYNNISETADTVFIDKYLNVDTSTLYVDATNNRVGIGTSSPSEKLFVQDGTIVAEQGTNGSTGRLVAMSNNGTPLSVHARNDNSAVNIGYNVYHNGSAFVVPNSSIGKWLWGWGTGATKASSFMDFYYADTSTFIGFGFLFRLTGEGDVGIGTSSPAQKLDVNGKVKIQDLTGTGGNAVYENGGVLGVASDARFKTYVGDIQNGIALINQLKPKYFIDNRNSSFQQLGFYAQEVKSVINEASYPIGNTDYLGINDRAILATTVKAIQEQQAIIETQEQKITDLETTIQALITRIENLENK